MAVQQNKKSPSKRGMHRSHDFLVAPPLAVEPTTACSDEAMPRRAGQPERYGEYGLWRCRFFPA